MIPDCLWFHSFFNPFLRQSVTVSLYLTDVPTRRYRTDKFFPPFPFIIILFLLLPFLLSYPYLQHTTSWHPHKEQPKVWVRAHSRFLVKLWSDNCVHPGVLIFNQALFVVSPKDLCTALSAYEDGEDFPGPLASRLASPRPIQPTTNKTKKTKAPLQPKVKPITQGKGGILFEKKWRKKWTQTHWSCFFCFSFLGSIIYQQTRQITVWQHRRKFSVCKWHTPFFQANQIGKIKCKPYLIDEMAVCLNWHACLNGYLSPLKFPRNWTWIKILRSNFLGTMVTLDIIKFNRAGFRICLSTFMSLRLVKL